jgi:signal transduction histidine kinase
MFSRGGDWRDTCPVWDGRLAVAITDNGSGGADSDAPFRGFRDRVEAFDRRMRIESWPGESTRLTAAIPCASPTMRS